MRDSSTSLSVSPLKFIVILLVSTFLTFLYVSVYKLSKARVICSLTNLAIAALMIVMFFFDYAEIYEPLGTIIAVLIVAFVSARVICSLTNRIKLPFSVMSVYFSKNHGCHTGIIICQIIFLK